jgi:cation diffusion facilitator family transporter
LKPASAQVRGQRLALIGAAANVLLAIVKLVAGLAGHSYALVADAIESLADIIGSAVIWGGLHISSRPASDKHPYGYGKAESLAAFLVAMMVFAAGIGIAVESIREIITPHHLPASYTLVVLIAVVVIKEALFRVVRRAAVETESGAMQTDAWHHRADAITSLAAAVGISLALYFKYPPADDMAALLAAAVILYNAVRLMIVPVRELLDVQSGEVVEAARRAAAGVSGVTNIQKVWARKSGMRYWIDMHIWVNPELTVREAHAISHRVKDAVRAALPAVQEVLIHVEPDGDPDPED